MYDDRDLVGVGGWLAFFVIILAVLTPLRMIVTVWGTLYGDPAVAAFYGEAWPVLQIFEWVIAAVGIAGAWYLAWRLLKVELWQTVRIVIAGIWVLGVGLTLVELVGVSLIAGLPVLAVMSGAGLEMARPFIFGALWTAYFLRSRRVANTYLKDADPEDIVEVFG